MTLDGSTLKKALQPKCPGGGQMFARDQVIEKKPVKFVGGAAKLLVPAYLHGSNTYLRNRTYIEIIYEFLSGICKIFSWVSLVRRFVSGRCISCPGKILAHFFHNRMC